MAGPAPGRETFSRRRRLRVMIIGEIQTPSKDCAEGRDLPNADGRKSGVSQSHSAILLAGTCIVTTSSAALVTGMSKSKSVGVRSHCQRGRPSTSSYSKSMAGGSMHPRSSHILSATTLCRPTSRWLRVPMSLQMSSQARSDIGWITETTPRGRIACSFVSTCVLVASQPSVSLTLPIAIIRRDWASSHSSLERPTSARSGRLIFGCCGARSGPFRSFAEIGNFSPQGPHFSERR